MNKHYTVYVIADVLLKDFNEEEDDLYEKLFEKIKQGDSVIHITDYEEERM